MAMITTYEQVGKKEDVSDIISNISPTKTPFQSAIGSEKINNTLFQWQEDSLRAVAVNAKAEGADAVDAAIVPTVMRTNKTQIITETVKTSGTADVVSTYGRAKESAYQLAKSAAQVKRDLEHAFVGLNQSAVTGDNSGPVARKMASYFAQLDSGVVNSTGANDGSAPLTEAGLLGLLQELYANGADPSEVHVVPQNATVVADFAKASGRYRTIPNGTSGDNTVINAVDLYVSPYGQVKVKINRFQMGNAGYASGAPLSTIAFDPDMWAKCVLRNWTRETLAKTGDAMRQMIVGEFSLKHKNFKASGAILEDA